MKRYLKYIAFLAVISLVVLWLAGVFRHKEETYEVKAQVRSVSGVEIGSVELTSQVFYSFSGNIVADKTAEISTRIMGKVLSVNVKEGDFVRQGQILVSVDAQDIQAQAKATEQAILQAQQAYNSAKAHLEAVEKTFRRYQELLKENAITKQEFDQIKAQYESALAQLKQAEAGVQMAKYQREAVASNLKYANITASFSGYVTQKRVDVGDIAIPGQPLLVLEAPPYQLEVFLPERYAGRVKVGQVYDVWVDSLGKTVKGRVIEVSPSLDPATRTFRVKLSLEGEGLKSGMFARMIIPHEERAIYVPTSAILKRFDFTGLYVVREDNTLELRYVKLGEERDGKVRVLSGLSGNERIVIKDVENACDGCKVGGH